MKVTALLVLSLAGCGLYFDGDSPSNVVLTLDGPLPDKCGSPEVHVIGIYEARGDHQGSNHPIGSANVAIERGGSHVLVLSAYEPTSWNVRLAPNAKLEAITLIGGQEQTVNVTNVPIDRTSGCGYSYPYDGEGCDTNELLALAEAHAGAPITSFHGCYQASSWVLHQDGTADSNCNTTAGYEVSEKYAECGGDGGGDGKDWESKDFDTFSPPTCTGARYVRRDEHYGVWIGAILCGGSTYYKLYMSEHADEPFLEIADYAGHGQDHCELVNPAFTIPDEDDITSGGCTECSVHNVVDPIDVPVYARARFGEPFERVTSQFWADLTTSVYSCGVSIP